MILPKELKAAMRTYYQNRKHANKGMKWDKAADLKAMVDLLPSNCSYFSATAGTFWLTWAGLRIQTTHSENNYWCCKVLARLNKKDEWVLVKEGVWA